MLDPAVQRKPSSRSSAPHWPVCLTAWLLALGLVWAATGAHAQARGGPSAAPPPGPADASTAPASPPPPTWSFSGDLRLRYERTSDQQPTAQPGVFTARQRAVTRLRVGAVRSFGTHVTAGARLTTGARGDPNTTDVTLGDFDDALEVRLDRAFLELHGGPLLVSGGKFANPLLSTELVWDADVNLQGLAASLTPRTTRRWQPRLVGVFFIVDEQTVNPDSTMAGAQVQWTWRPGPGCALVLAGGYYDYTIKSLKDADSGDTRSNRLTAGGLAYLSDFNLVDAVITFDHGGFGPRWPLRLVGDWVKNLGADDRNVGWLVDVFVGRSSDRGDLRARYGYSRADTDAVLAAFSHDNTTLATQYEQHTLGLDYQVRKGVQVNATGYVYRQLAAGAAANVGPWITRLRLNALVTF